MSPTSPTPPARAEAYPEHDKLGPLATPTDAERPAYADGAAMRGLILAAIDHALEPARAARGRVTATPATAVHQVRKALRRTRALVDLLDDVLPKRTRRAIRAALVTARRSLGPARDLAVASEALVQVAVAPEVAPAAAAIVAAARADAPSHQAIADDVASAVEVALAQAGVLAAALPAEVPVRAVLRGLAATYGRARRARRKARHSERAVHRWRRRSKELSYQLSLFRELGAADELRDAMVALDHQLGQVVDRLMLNDFVGLYGHAAEAEAVGALLIQLHDELHARHDAARQDTKELFAVRPRKLRKRLLRAILPPAHAGDDDGDDGDASDDAAAVGDAPKAAAADAS